MEPRLPELSEMSSDLEVIVLSAVTYSWDVDRLECVDTSLELCAVSYSVVVRPELSRPLLAENMASKSDDEGLLMPPVLVVVAVVLPSLAAVA